MAPDVRPCHYKNNDTTDADRRRASAALFGQGNRIKKTRKNNDLGITRVLAYVYI